MTIQEIQKLKTEVLEKYTNLTQEDWLDKIKYRGIEHKYENQLNGLIDYYCDEINKEQKGIGAPFFSKSSEPNQVMLEYAEWKQHKKEYIERIEDKLSACVMELTLRKSKAVSRILHGTTYYIDFTNGLDTNNGLGIGTAWKTINKYTTTTVRTAGDIAYVRANMTLTQNTADITFDEGGTTAAPIQLVGCNVTQGIDPWSDASDVRPIIDFADAAYQVVASRGYWQFKNLEFRQSTDGNGLIYISYTYSYYLYNCKFNDSGSSGTEGLLLGGSTNIIVEDCIFVDCWGISLSVTVGSTCLVKNCSLDGGSVRGSTYGIYAANGSVIEVIDSDFGQTVAFTTNDLYAVTGGRIYCRNCVTNGSYATNWWGSIFLEDDDGVFNAHKTILYNGVLDRVTTPIRTGGASSSLKIAPNANCTGNWPIEVGRDKFLTGTFQVYLTAGAHTITVHMYGDGWGGTLPSSTECYIQTSYLSNAATADRTVIASNDSLAEDSWTAFDTAFTAARDGWAYTTVVLKKYVASAVVYIDIKPVVS